MTSFKGCDAKTGVAGGKVGNCNRLLCSSCPSPTPSSGIIINPRSRVLRVRWYLSYSFSYRQVAEMVGEGGKFITARFSALVQHYGPELEKRCRPELRPTNDSSQVDETYIEVKGKWRYLYRAVDADGNIKRLYCSRRARDDFIGEAVFP